MNRSTHTTDTTTEENIVSIETSPTYVRGTKTVKRTTAALAAGDRVLTTEPTTTSSSDSALIFPASSKTGSYVRTVAGKTAHLTSGFHRAQRRYVLTFTDGMTSAPFTPAQTWHHVPAEVPAVTATDDGETHPEDDDEYFDEYTDVENAQ